VGVAVEDQARWDARYARQGPVPLDEVRPPPRLASHLHHLPPGGHALDVACGRGATAVSLARQGLHVRGVDVSPVAVDQARRLARLAGVAQRCRFDVVDLDAGLPGGPPVDVVVCHMFRDPRLDRALIERLAPGGLLAVVALSEVGATPGRFRVPPGALTAAFAELDVVAAGEGGGEAWLVARARDRRAGAVAVPPTS
jgi:2-polyprenyl-3-methyl-5-hydroxy-6-metoxy-1,4-benzoquinol methylase